jgi:hypothetical protein
MSTNNYLVIKISILNVSLSKLCRSFFSIITTKVAGTILCNNQATSMKLTLRRSPQLSVSTTTYTASSLNRNI